MRARSAGACSQGRAAPFRSIARAPATRSGHPRAVPEGGRPRHVIGDELHQGSGYSRGVAGNRNQQAAAAADLCHQLKNLFQRDAFTAENVAMSRPPTFHGQNQPRRGIAHVDEVDDEIEIQLKALAEKVPEHGRRRSEVVIMRSDRHRRTADDHRKTGRRGLRRQFFREQFRARIRPRHVVGSTARNLPRRAASKAKDRKRMDSVEQCRNRAMPRLRAAAMTTSRAAAIDVLKIFLARRPHSGQAGEVINLARRRSSRRPPAPDRAPSLRHTARPARCGSAFEDREPAPAGAAPRAPLPGAVR